jgi:hypothetical protein
MRYQFLTSRIQLFCMATRSKSATPIRINEVHGIRICNVRSSPWLARVCLSRFCPRSTFLTSSNFDRRRRLRDVLSTRRRLVKARPSLIEVITRLFMISRHVGLHASRTRNSASGNPAALNSLVRIVPTRTRDASGALPDRGLRQFLITLVSLIA